MKNAILFLVAFLVGCGVGLTKEEAAALTPEQKIFKLANEVNIAFTPAVAYAQQEKCTATRVVACHDPGVVKIFLRLREEANAAFKVARADVDLAAVSVLTGVVRRVLAELQAELLKTKGARYDTSNRFAFT
jgi:tartrate dehydratase alpha subunit/fumarate hydratase class I-like protein